MPLRAGDKLGPYEIVAILGEGGMGEVSRARDPRLGRDVAIKISRRQFEGARQKVIQAQALSAHLSPHPFVAQPNRSIRI